MDVVDYKNLSPELRLTASHQVPSLLFEHRIIIRDGDELIITKAFCIGDVRQVGVASLAKFTDNQWFVQLEATIRTNLQYRGNETHIVFFEELLRVIITVDKDLRHSVVNSRILATCLHTSLEPGQDQLQPIPLFYLIDKLINRKVTGDRSQQSFDRGLITVNIQETTNNLGSADRVDLLHVYLNKLGEAILIEI